jgi:hypothetical protein
MRIKKKIKSRIKKKEPARRGLDSLSITPGTTTRFTQGGKSRRADPDGGG